MTTIYTFATLDLVNPIWQKKTLRSLGVLFLLFLMFLPAGRLSYAQNSSGTDTSKEIIVVFKNRPTISLLAAVSDTTTQNLEIKNGITASNAMVFSVATGDVKNAMNDLSKNPNVAAVFPNYKLHLLAIPNDPEAIATPMPNLPRDQWYLFNLNLAGTGQSAWDVTTGSPNVVVAVVDTGVQSDHADFKNSDNSSKFSSLVDCTGSACQEVSSLTDNNAGGHGTAVAGLVAAATNNGNGISGTGYNTKIMAIRIVDASGSTTQDKLINAMTWAADHGAKVINLSVGVVADSLTADAIKQYNDAVSYAWNKGAVVVSAAGNCGSNAQGNAACAIYQNGDQNTITGYANNSKLYPAASPNVISVAALTVNNTLASYSEHNDSANSSIGNWVDVAAPGGDGACTSATKTCILSTIPTNQLYWQEGTSMAAPQVAGVAALLFAVNPNLTNTQVKSIIETTANNSAASGSTNFGLVNALAAVQQAGTTVAATATPTPNGGTPSVTPNPNLSPTVTLTPTTAVSPTITPTAGPTATPTVTPYPTTAPKLPRQLPSPMPAAPYCPQTILNGGTSDAGMGRFFSFHNPLVRPAYALSPDISSGLIGYWNMDEPSGQTAADSAGNNNTGTVTGTTIVSGKIGSARQLNGLTDYITAANPTNFNFDYNTPFSIAAWIKPTRGHGDYQTIVSKAKVIGPAYPGYVFRLNPLSQLEFVLVRANSPTYQFAWVQGQGTDISDSQWHHVAATYNGNGSASGMQLYLDGNLLTKITPFDTLGGGSIVNSEPLMIGRQNPQTIGYTPIDANQYGNFAGMLDDVRVYNRALSGSDVTGLYTFTVPSPTTPSTLTATPAVGATATPVASTYCSMKSQGDANCDGKVDLSDYNLWTQQFDTMIPAQPTNQNSNFMCVEGNTSTYFVDLVDFEIWRRNTTNGLIIPGSTVPTTSLNPNTQVNLSLIPAQTTFPLNGTQIFTLQASFPGGSAAQKLDGFTTEIDFSKDILMMPAGQYIDTSTSGFKKILRVDGPTQANGSGKIIISLLADVPGGGPATDKTITIATIKFQAKALASNQSISLGKTQIVNNLSQALTVSTAGTTFTVQ